MAVQYLGNIEFDITKSLRDYEYTKRSVVDLNRVVDSKQFEEMDSETIFQYLKDQMEVISFSDYLKRYIYEESGIDAPFAEVPEEFYLSTISESFSMNRAPHSFTPVKTRWSNIIKRWLRSDSAKRTSIFLLGFGLRMSDREVSDFLTKVIKEQDFRFHDPAETIFWYCFHHDYPYSKAVSLQEFYRAVEEDNTQADPDFWASVGSSLTVYLSNENKLKEYLVYLKLCQDDPQEMAFREFQSLYERALDAVSILLEKSGQKKEALSGAYGIEAVLCSGTPMESSNNLIPVTRSTLSRQFDRKRMSRQRISRLLRRQLEVERFDIISLLFLVYAVTVEPDWPTERYMEFIDEVNDILKRCGMMGIYPVNPYESFVLMCLLTEEPLSVYNDVWEMSYED